MPGPGRLAARQPGHAHQAAHALGDLVHAAAGRVRAVLAEPGDRAVDQPRVAARAPSAKPKPSRSLTGGPHVLDQHVGRVRQAQQHVTAARRLEVQGQRPLVPVQVLEVAAVPGFVGRAVGGVAGRRLHPDDVGPPVGQLADAGRAGPRHGEVDDPDVAEREMPHPNDGTHDPARRPAGPPGTCPDPRAVRAAARCAPARCCACARCSAGSSAGALPGGRRRAR